MKRMVLGQGAAPVEVDVPLWEMAPPVVVHLPPTAVSRRQLLLALVAAELISGEEALAAATTGAVPAVIDAVFGALPEADALAARITWATMSVVERSHPLIASVGAALGLSEHDIDAAWSAAAGL